MIRTDPTVETLTRQRVRATQESHARARRHITAEGVALPSPTPNQVRLEGELFTALRIWHSVVPADLRPPWDSFRIHRVHPAADSLTVGIDPDVVSCALARILPRMVDGEVVGVPGLRVRRVDAGIAVHLIGHAAQVTFSGVTLTNVVEASVADQWEGLPTFAWSSPNDLSAAEQAATRRMLSAGQAAVVSCVVRRLGVFIEAGAHSVDSWIGAEGRVCVEAFFQSDSSQRDSLIAEFTDPALTPVLDPVSVAGLWPPVHHTFRVGDGLLDLRLHYADESNA